MFIVFKDELCSLKSTFDCIDAYSRFVVYFFYIIWTGACISRDIIIETFNFQKSKMRDTTGNQLSIIWFAFRCAKCLSVMFGIIGKLRFWINYILTSFDFYAEIQAKNWTANNRSFHGQKSSGQSRKIVEKYLRSFPYRSCILKNANCLRNSFYPTKINRLFTHYANGKYNR